MKTVFQIFACMLSLAALLGGAASSAATAVADVPLRASVLAKPNLIFATDDSGSMDFEMMIDTNGGTLWWDLTNGKGKAGGKPLQGGGSGEWDYFYLFPNGVAAGSRQYDDPSTTLGYAVPPTPELGWVRSSTYNPLYYDSKVTYDPWSPAYLGSAVQSFVDSTPGAAKSHPVNGSATFKLDANMVNSNTDWRFMFAAGMTIPAGATVHGCENGSNPSSLPYTVATSKVACMASMSYYPATFWVRENCTVDNVTCSRGPDDLTVKRYEIKSGNTFPSGRTYANEMKNFANWFTYYRKRRLMLAASMGQVMENLSGLRMGVVYFNNRQPVTMYDADATLAAANRLRVAGMFYTPERNAGTPTRETLLYAGAQFQRVDSGLPLDQKVIQYACQRNNTFVVTDGFAAPSNVTVPSYTQATYGSGAPYSTIHAKSLADIALAYYTINPRPDLATGQLKPEDAAKQNADRNTNLHMNTYGLTLGLKGLQWTGVATPSPFSSPPTWAAPTAQDRTQIDDLWHATINGRGKMYVATSPDETAASLRAGINEMLNFRGSQGSLALATVNLGRGDGQVYSASYNPAGWSGDVRALGISKTSGTVGSETWAAGPLLDARDWTTRVIAAGGGVAFTAAGVGATVNPSNTYGTSADVINYLRGERSNEGTLFRQRTSRLGAIINAEPVVSDGVLYVPSGDGMLHAFETRGADAGKELWAFVPRPVLATLGQTVPRGWSFRTRLDGTPTVGSNGAGGKLLVAGMGPSGRSFYALDVSAPRGLSESALAAKTHWQFPAVGDSAMAAKVGLSLGKPLMVKSAGTGDGQVVLVTSGYDSTADGKGRLWLLNATTGAVIKEFVVAAGTLAAESGLAQITAYAEADGSVQYVYGGDLLGNVWRFDLKLKDAPKLVAVLKGPAGDLQGVTTPPELVSAGGKRVVVVGTGRTLDVSDWGNAKVQSIYAISDDASLSNARTSLVQQTYNRATDTMSNNPVDWATQRGWFLDLAAKEHINVRPVVAYGVLAFVSNTNGASDCSASAYYYWVNVLSGGKVVGVDTVSHLITDKGNAAAPTLAISADGRLLAQTKTTDDEFPDPKKKLAEVIRASKDSWREVRR